jgi:hypothetical protein
VRFRIVQAFSWHTWLPAISYMPTKAIGNIEVNVERKSLCKRTKVSEHCSTIYPINIEHIFSVETLPATSLQYPISLQIMPPPMEHAIFPQTKQNPYMIFNNRNLLPSIQDYVLCIQILNIKHHHFVLYVHEI